MKIMVKKELMDEIFVLTTQIQKEFPELYVNLKETPLFMSGSEKDISTADFEQYHESLEMQLAVFRKTSAT